MTRQSTVRLGVVGLGNIARQHVDNIASGQVMGCELVALCSRRDSELADALGLPHFADYRQLIDSGLCDAVLVATPTFSHAAVGGYALRAALHLGEPAG